MFLINLSVLLSAAAAISFEIIGGSVLTVLLGSSIYYFSLVIGVFLAALGIGGWLSAKLENKLEEKSALIAGVLALTGGSAAFVIFGGYVLVFEVLRGMSFNNIFGFLAGISFGQLFFSFFALAFLFGIGVLAGLLLPLFSRIVAVRTPLKDALGKVFFWDYAGALFVSVLLPILFFPSFGLIKTSFLMGLVSALAALAMAVFMRREKIELRPILILALAAAFVMNFVGFFNANKIENFLEKKQYGDREIIYRGQSPYQKFVFLEDEESGKISLYINGQRQFESGEWDETYHKTFVHPAMALKQSAPNLSVLVLGGGDGLALREIFKYGNISKVTLVDIDSSLVTAAKNLEEMKALNENAFIDSRVEVVFDDAFKFVEENFNKNFYDIVFIDFPDPTDDGLARLYSKEFYLNLKKVLQPDGIVVVQSNGYMVASHKTILLTMEAAGFNVLAFHPIKYDILDQNFGFTLASNGVISPNDLPLELRDIFAAAPIPKQKSPKEINSIFRPSIVKNAGGGFIENYLQSQPMEKILAQINLSPSKIREEFKRMFYK
ncbi:MAG: fused MFS/spermidine synthase [Patescibacteria group bacterium]|nr:fused MFS/spermidine synthase [Patescibacteria group bacterium]